MYKLSVLGSVVWKFIVRDLAKGTGEIYVM